MIPQVDEDDINSAISVTMTDSHNLSNSNNISDSKNLSDSKIKNDEVNEGIGTVGSPELNNFLG